MPTRVYTCICSKLFFIFFKTLWLGNNSPASLGSENDLDLSCSALDIPKVEKDSNRIRTPLKEMTNHNVIPKKIISSSLSPLLSSCSPPSRSSDTPQLQQSFCSPLHCSSRYYQMQPIYSSHLLVITKDHQCNIYSHLTTTVKDSNCNIV